MGIRVAHEADAGLTGMAALLAGQGQYKKWLDEHQQRASIEAARLNQQAQLQREQIDAQRERDAFQAKLSLAKDDSDFDQRLQLTGIQNDFTRERDEFSAGTQRERDQFSSDQRTQFAEDDVERDVRRDELKYKAADQHRINQIDEDIRNIEADENLSDEEREYALIQKHAERDRYKPIKQAGDYRETTEKELADGSIAYTDEYGKTHIIRKPPEKPAKPEITFKDKLAYQNAINNYANKLMSATDAEDEPLYTPEEALQKAKEAYAHLNPDNAGGRNVEPSKEQVWQQIPDQARAQLQAQIEQLKVAAIAAKEAGDVDTLKQIAIKARELKQQLGLIPAERSGNAQPTR